MPLSGAGLCEAVIIAPHVYSAAPRASVGVETSPASTTSDPVDKTPARIAGWDQEIGSIAVGKRADLLILDKNLNVRHVYLKGRPFS